MQATTSDNVLLALLNDHASASGSTTFTMEQVKSLVLGEDASHGRKSLYPRLREQLIAALDEDLMQLEARRLIQRRNDSGEVELKDMGAFIGMLFTIPDS